MARLSSYLMTAIKEDVMMSLKQCNDCKEEEDSTHPGDARHVAFKPVYIPQAFAYGQRCVSHCHLSHPRMMAMQIFGGKHKRR